MFNRKLFARNIALIGALTFMLGTPAFAQSRATRNGRYANRTVEGTIAAVATDRGGDHIRLTNGMDLVVPRSITALNQGRRYGASMLHPGDVVRMSVYSREGDGRDAQVRSLEILSWGAHGNEGQWNDRDHPFQRMDGTVVSVNRRAQVLVIRGDNGRTFSIDFTAFSGRTSAARLRRGDRVTVSGHLNRGGSIIPDEIRFNRH